MGVAAVETAQGARPRRAAATYGSLVAVLAVLAALVIGSRPLADNSFLTHLATGRLILDEGRVPTSDPYSYTAAGEPWVVQSWLASVAYATAERAGGALGLRLLYAGLSGLLGLALWKLTAAAEGVIVRLGLLVLALAVGAQLWDERPFMFGLVLLSLYLLACERAVPGPVLAAAAWVWANTHGSFPLGLVAVSALAIGARVDGEPALRELKTLRWTAGGTVLAVVGPLGLRVLAFPLDLLGRQDVLKHVVEWQAPTFQEPGDRAFLVLLLVAVASLVRQPRWRQALPVLVFSAAGLLAQRNLVVASLVLVVCASKGLGGLGSIRTTTALRGASLLSVPLVVALGTTVLVTRFAGEDYAIAERYPVTSLAYLEAAGVDLSEARLVTTDVVGNLLTGMYPDERVVWFDDRYDMYPEEIPAAYLTLLRGAPGWREALARLRADYVIWDRGQPLAQLLLEDRDWQAQLIEDRWVLFCGTGSAASSSTC